MGQNRRAVRVLWVEWAHFEYPFRAAVPSGRRAYGYAEFVDSGLQVKSTMDLRARIGMRCHRRKFFEQFATDGLGHHGGTDDAR